MTSNAHDLGAELEELRMAHDWTYTELTEQIAAVTDHNRDADCWRRICQGLTPKPQARTIHIMGLFLEAARRPRRRQATRRQRRAA